MTTVYVTCGWCNEHVELSPSDIVLTVKNRRSLDGQYRWWHCGQLNMKRATQHIFSVLLAAGCEVEYTDDFEVLAFSYELDEVRTLADMGWVS